MASNLLTKNLNKTIEESIKEDGVWILSDTECKVDKKVDDETTPLRASILKQHEKIYDVRMECFDKVKKMADKVKVIEKHLGIVSQILFGS